MGVSLGSQPRTESSGRTIEHRQGEMIPPSASAGQTVEVIAFCDWLFCSMVCARVLVSVTCPLFLGSFLDIQARQVG